MPIDKEKFVSHVKEPGARKAMLRFLDLWEKAFLSQIPVVTDFFDPYYLGIATGIIQGLPKMGFSVDGGFEGAERARIAIFPSLDSEIDFRLAFLRAEGNFKFRAVSHRDYMGSLLGLGLTREKIGDIIVTDTGCQVIVDRDIADYVIYNWNKVSQVTVGVTQILREEIVLPQQEVKEIKATAASPRLDAIMGIGFGCSRTKILPEIKAGRVRVNWKVVSDPSVHVKVGDRISCMGRGRLEFADSSGTSQKGRLFVKILRFI